MWRRLLFACSVLTTGCASGNGTTTQVAMGSLQLTTATTEGDDASFEVVTLYSFPLPTDPQNASFTGLMGSVSMTSATDVFNEVLYTIADDASGACPPDGTMYAAPTASAASPYARISADYPALSILQQYILKLPSSGTTGSSNDFQLPANLTSGSPVANCVVVMVDWMGGSSVQVQGDLRFEYSESSQVAAPAAALEATGGEFCLGQDWGCMGATTDLTQSFANVTVIAEKSQLLSLAGNISDSPFDDSGVYGPPPVGPWSMKNDIVLMPGGCNAFSQVIAEEANGVYLPGDYYSSTYLPPGSYQTLLSVPLSGTGQEPLEASVAKNFDDVFLDAGDCLISLVGMSGDGAVDADSQVNAYVMPFPAP